MSCLRFSEMSIYFRFGEFRATLYVLFLGKVMPNFCMTFGACMHFYNQFVYYYRAGVHDGQWNDCGKVVAVGGAGHE